MMITYYTSIGSYELRKDTNGMEQPVLITNGKEYTPTVNEMALWSMLLWHIEERRALRTAFEKRKADLHTWDDLSFEYYIVRLEKLGYLRSAQGCTAADALYNLMAPLYLTPVSTSVWVKICTFLHLMIRRRLPMEMAARVFRSDNLTTDEKVVLRYAKQNQLSLAEMICCMDQGIRDVSKDETIMERIYESADISCDTLPAYTRASARLVPVLQAVIDLYIKRLLVLEVL